MGKVIAIASQKGGVGKTTTAINLSACLAEANKNVLLIDLDPQGNTTSGLGIDKYNTEITVYNVLLAEYKLTEVILNTCVDGLSLVPSNVNLAGAEIELIEVDKREFILKNELKSLTAAYDYIIIDCPPSLNILTINALTAADSVVVPIQCEYFALEGLSQLIHTVDLVKKRLNPNISIEGAVFTMFDARTNLSLQIIDEVKKYLNANIYKTIIPRNVRLSEAPSHGVPIIKYDKRSRGAESYRLLAQEVIGRGV